MIGQLARFAGIGLLATLTHVSVALLASSLIGFGPQAANFAGFLSAVALSYFGHGRITFRAEMVHEFHGPRFLVASMSALLLSTALTQILTVWLGAHLAVAMAAVGVVVPAASFLLYRFWVFPQDQATGP
ncbi:GtrA family protein [Jannaschia aquimarina]|uniref:GtrA-like protein n=1 Tax=Jannaschia aquimarina TaxID=935700 RepID=A0A0D1CQH7_9RHOB|nr:GtrA family protein [Jannaschia aquimarina]KIT17042.1 GtrA-like protein [Jannaschia aquimarina]SNS82105.1 Putative flippase GtrA (transmembrane translocase of bactoprenol-linked glucose) [Jannaschia aquimarina]